MSITGIPIPHAPSALEQYKTLIRHVHGEPVMIRRAMRIAFRSSEPQRLNRIEGLAGRTLSALMAPLRNATRSVAFFASFIFSPIPAAFVGLLSSLFSFVQLTLPSGHCFRALAPFHQVQKLLRNPRFDGHLFAIRPLKINTKEMQT